MILPPDSYWYNGGVAEGVRQGLFVDLSDYVEEYAPDYYRRVNANEAVKKEIVNDEKYYAMSDYYIESTVKTISGSGSTTENGWTRSSFLSRSVRKARITASITLPN